MNFTASRRCHDGIYDNFVSQWISKWVVNLVIGSLLYIKPTLLRVVLNTEQYELTFSFSKSFTAPRTVHNISSGNLFILNVTNLVSDD